MTLRLEDFYEKVLIQSETKNLKLTDDEWLFLQDMFSDLLKRYRSADAQANYAAMCRKEWRR